MRIIHNKPFEYNAVPADQFFRSTKNLVEEEYGIKLDKITNKNELMEYLRSDEFKAIHTMREL